MSDRCRRRLRSGAGLLFLVVAILVGAGTASAQILFGKNKVVYEDREWWVFEDGMLHVYFYPGEEELARYTLDVARETYAEYSDYFDFEFEEPIPLVLYGTHNALKETHVIPGFVDDGTAGFTEFAKGRIALRATGNRAELRHLIRHEMVHAFMLSKLATVMSDRRIFDYEGPPLWFIEGMAESIANRRPDWRAHMMLRDAVLQDGLVGIPDMWTIFGSFLMYKEGESILDFLRVQYDDRMPAILLEHWWKGRDLDDLLQQELGMSLEDLDRRWRAYLKRRYFPEILTRRSAREQGRLVDEKTYFETSPFQLPPEEDGSQKLVCLSYRDGPLSLYEVTIPSRGDPHYRRLVEGGRNAAFESLPPLRSRIDVHAGREIAFVAKHGGRDALYVYDLTEQEIVFEYRLEAGDPVVEISSPSFSPDGQRLVFSGLSAGGHSDLWLVDRATQHLRRLTDDEWQETHPSWHPDSDRVLFASDRGHADDGLHDVYEMELSSSDPPRLRVSGPAHDTAPRWVGGDDFVLVSDRDGAPNVYLCRGDSVAALSDVTGGEFFPQAERRDGELRIAAAVYFERRFQLHLMTVADDAALKWEPARVVQEPAPPSLRLASDQPHPPRVTASPYEVEFGLDFVQSVVALDPDLPYGSGASLGFTDLLGNHQVFLHFGTAGDNFSLQDLNAGLSWTDQTSRWNRHLGLFRLAVRPNGFDRDLRDISEVRTGGFAGLTYPLSKFRRVEMSTVFRHLQRDPPGISGGSGSTLGTIQSRAWLWSVFASYVSDNTLWRWDGPVRGSRTHLTLGQTFDLSGEGFERSTVQLDTRRYQSGPGRSVLALRASSRLSFGQDPLPYYLWGSLNVRGLDFYTRKIAFTNLELRVPLLDGVGLRFPFGDLTFPPIRAHAFFDAAWLEDALFIDNFGRGISPDSHFLGSLGYGASMVVYPPVAVRMDVLRTHDFDSLSPWDVRWGITLVY
jgi:hypothetical protein